MTEEKAIIDDGQLFAALPKRSHLEVVFAVVALIAQIVTFPPPSTFSFLPPPTDANGSNGLSTFRQRP